MDEQIETYTYGLDQEHLWAVPCSLVSGEPQYREFSYIEVNGWYCPVEDYVEVPTWGTDVILDFARRWLL